MKKLSVLLLLCLMAAKAIAQPSDAQVRKEMTGSGTISVTLSKNPGTKSWNSDTKNDEYTRGVVIKRKTEYPGINVIITGSAVYQWVGGKYSYWKFRSVSQEYEGIPNPKDADILAFIEKDIKDFYGDYNYRRITEVLESPKLASEPHWYWHSPLSVSFDMKVKYKIKSTINTDNLDLTEQLYVVRLYRDDMKQPWQRFLSSAKQEADSKTVLGSETFPREKLDKLSTLADKRAEAATQAVIAAGGDMKIPDSGSFQDLVMFLHKLLRDGNAEQLRAALIQTLAPNMDSRDAIINRIIDEAYNHDLKYKDVYCTTPNINTRQSNAKNFYFIGNTPNTNSVFSGSQVAEGYVEGQPVTKWKIGRIVVGMRFDDDAVKYLSSFSDKKKLCPND
ncbi:MAG: hypothetical protein IAF08_04390 [Rhizobacter sp.]|nr:hypothetical protein [Chlorobiales bacterium]